MYFKCEYLIGGGTWPFPVRYVYDGPYDIKYSSACSDTINSISVPSGFETLKIQIPISKTTGLNS